MGCGSGGLYTKKDVEEHVAELQLRLPSAELVNGGIIKVTGVGGFFNTNPPLDSTWFQGKMTTSEFRQAIEHINQCTSQSAIETSKKIPLNQFPKTHAITLAIEELNAKYAERVHFVYQQMDQEKTIDSSTSFIYIDFK